MKIPADYDELVRRLRAAAATWEVDPDELADAITKLRAERDMLTSALSAMYAAATDDKWPRTSEQMLPMHLARVALAGDKP